ncbi:MAG: CPBP family intramembrane glutamic endopeptidase [Luteibaculaceae bacterium]
MVQMEKERYSPSFKIFILILYVLGGLILSAVLVAAFAFLKADSVEDALTTASEMNVAFIRINLLLNHLGMFILPGILFFFYPGSKLISTVSRKNFPAFWLIFLTGAITLTAIPFVSYLGWLNAQINLPESLAVLESNLQNLERQAKEITVVLLSPNGYSDLMLNLFLAAMIPAIGEEFVFRGILQPNLIKIFKNAWLGLLVTSILFSAMHLQFYGFLPRFFIGFFIGYMVMITGNLWYGILAHFVNNAFLVLLVFVASRYFDVSAETFLNETDDSDVSVLFWLPGILLCFYLLKRFEKTAPKIHAAQPTPSA